MNASNEREQREALRLSMRSVSTDMRRFRRIADYWGDIGRDRSVFDKVVSDLTACVRALRERHSSHFRSAREVR